jgi:hypothetical protein
MPESVTVDGPTKGVATVSASALTLYLDCSGTYSASSKPKA